MVTGGLVSGVARGLVSGYFGGRIDMAINRTGEVFSAFPDILLMIIIAATLRPRLRQGVHWIEDNTFVDGLIHVSSMTEDYYTFDVDRYTLVGERSRRVFRLGDRLTVRISRVDKEERLIDFTLVDKKRDRR